MTAVIHYVPRIMCAKCKAPAQFVRHVHQQPEKRFLAVECHGDKTTVPFTTDKNAEVTVFE